MIHNLRTALRLESGQLNIYGKIVVALVLLLAVHFLLKILSAVINRSINSRLRMTQTKTYATLSKLLVNVIRYVLYFLAGVQILSLFGVNTASIIATAGIGGLAIGLGAQFLVKDILSGVFLIVEERYHVGDYVKINAVDGVVREIGLKSTTLLGFDGAIHTINNGQIQQVTNMSKTAQKATVELHLSYGADLEKVDAVVGEISDEIMKAHQKKMIQKPKYVGVTAFHPYYQTVQVWAYTVQGEQWLIEREIRRLWLEKTAAQNSFLPINPLIAEENHEI